MTSDDSLRFGPVEVRIGQRQLLVSGVVVSIGDRAFDVLCALIDRADRVVTKDELLDIVWSGLVVEENNLQVQISALRKLIGPQAIATIPGRGYRFTLPPRTEAGSVDAERPNATQPTPLPAPTRTLYGRSDDLAQLLDLLSHHALVTLTGPGGIGKTRLATATAERLCGREADRSVAWVDLSSLDESSLIPATIAAGLGLTVAGHRNPVDALISALKAGSTLLVLDNCEHLIDYVAKIVATLLAATHDLRVLATSRLPLRVPGERVFRLEALAIPDASLSLVEASIYGAVALFASRVSEADRHFTLNEQNVQEVIRICHRLEGIPLALELAAARVPALGLMNLTALLEHRILMLGCGERSAPDRHQTMVAAYDWSHGLLTDEQKTVFRRLSVFTGGFTLDAARAVTASETSDPWAAVDALAGLVDFSLVAANRRDPPRYTLLETGRAYAAARLSEAHEVDAIAHRHAKHYCELVVDAYDSWVAGPEAVWVAQTSPELANLRAALGWALGPNGDSATAVALAGSAMPIWLDLGVQDFTEARQSVRAAMGLVRGTTDPKMEARLWFAQGLLAPMSAGRDQITAYRRCVALYRTANDNAALHLALTVLARTLTQIGEFDDAKETFDEVLRLPRHVATQKLIGLYNHAVGRHRHLTEQFDEARALHERAIECFEAEACETLAILAHCDLAQCTWGTQNLDAAADEFRAAVDRTRAVNLPAGQGLLGAALGGLVAVLIEQGRLAEAEGPAREALPLLKVWDRARSLFEPLALRLTLLDRHEEAARLVGHVDHCELAPQFQRDPNRRRVRRRLEAALRQRFDAETLKRLLSEGAQLSEAEAYRMAAP